MTILSLSTADAHQLPVFAAIPSAPQALPRASLVVLHEAFAVTPHIQRVCHHYAAQGFACLAPDMLARGRLHEEARQGHINPLWEHLSGADGMPSLPINKPGLDLARGYISATTRDQNLADIDACIRWLKAELPAIKVGVIGYCFGGSMAYYTATHSPDAVHACVAYYGGMLGEMAAERQPRCPTLVHLARQDRYIPWEPALQSFRQYHPAAEVHVHAADHGFNRDDGVTYDAAIAAQAGQRSLAFLQQHLF